MTRREKQIRVAALGITCVLSLAIPLLAAMSPAAMQQATELYQKKDWNGLANLAEPATRADSKDGWAWYYSGLANDGLGRRDRAAAAFEIAKDLVPDYLRGSVVQLLAQDYVALKQPDKLLALFHGLQKSRPDLAQSLQAQFRSALGTQEPPRAAVPDISPQTVAAMTKTVRSTWRSDAIAVKVNVNSYGSRFQVAFDFYSPSTKTGLSVVQLDGKSTNLPAANPNWGESAIPDNFLPLGSAIARAKDDGVAGILDHAFLYRTGRQAQPTDLVWDLAMTTNTTRGVELAAYVIPKDEFDRLLHAAERGDAGVQLIVARVYLLGLAGPLDSGQAFKWCSQSAQHGNVEAENLLGQMYQAGIGTPANVGLAVHWYQMAANAGNAAGEYNLGLMFESGRGVPRNYVSAQQWIAKAARQGLVEAQDELPYVTARAKGQQVSQAQAAAHSRPGKCAPMYHWSPFINMCSINLGFVPTIK